MIFVKMLCFVEGIEMSFFNSMEVSILENQIVVMTFAEEIVLEGNEKDHRAP